jgi:hypothetical protein
MMTRRAMLSKLVLGATAAASGAMPVRLSNSAAPPASSGLAANDRFLDELQFATARIFWEFAHPQTGLVLDRAQPTTAAGAGVASIAATGFGLSALCLADQRGWLSTAAARSQVRRTLRFCHDQLPAVQGFHYHFVDWRTGARALNSEVSSIDTAILLCGVLTCRAYFADAEIQALATAIYDRVNWRWLWHADGVLGHGWRPETGFLRARWEAYCEHTMLYLLALGARQHAIPAESWHAWRRPTMRYAGHEFIAGDPALFTHQYAHAWFDFRGRPDDYADYFENSRRATLAHQQFCADLGDEFPTYRAGLWGITPSAAPSGYAIWGGPARHGPIDGSIVPCAAGGSLPFLPDECIGVLRLIRERHGEQAWGRLGFVDAFNPATGWTAAAPLAINSGITLVMAENARSGFIWRTFHRNPEVQAGLARAGFRSRPAFG